jgi:transcriptional regulator with XRE-family HTH domain
MRRRREELGLKLTELALKTGVNYQTLATLDAGRGKGFNPKIKLVVAEALGVGLFDLYPEELERLDYASGAGLITIKRPPLRKGAHK